MTEEGTKCICMSAPKQQIERIAGFFSIFSNPTRLLIFCTLQAGPKTVSELAKLTDASIQNVSQHLRMMRDKGAVQPDRKGQNIYYSISDPRLYEAISLISKAIVDISKTRF